MRYVVLGQNYISSNILNLGNLSDIVILNETALAKNQLNFVETDKIYSPAESSLPIIIKKISKNHHLKNAIEKLKNKALFRRLLQPLYPRFFFQSLAVNQLPNLRLNSNKKYVVKPEKGFFSAAVKIIDHKTDLKKLT